MDPVERGKMQMGGFERFLSRLPGLGGYREKELRRNADKQVRDTLAQELEQRRAHISSMQAELLSNGGLLWMDDMERVVGKLQLLIDRVRTAAYGYAGFFSLDRVKEPELESLVAYDQSLFEDLPDLDSAITTLEGAVRANENIKEALAGVTSPISALADKFTKRTEAIRGA